MKKNRYAINALSGVASQISLMGSEAILLSYMIHHLGPEAFGVSQTVRSGMAILLLAQIGMGPTLIRFFSIAFAKNESLEIIQIARVVNMVMLVLATIVTLAGIGFIPYFNDFFNIPQSLWRDTYGLLLCMVFSLFLNIMLIIPQGIILSSDKYVLSNYNDIVFNVVRLLLTVYLFGAVRPTLVYFGIAFLLASALRYGVALYISSNLVGGGCFLGFKNLKLDKIKPILNFSAINCVNWIAATIVFQAPVLILGKVGGPIGVTYYAPALLVAMAIQSLLIQVTRPLVPMASAENEKNTKDGLAKMAIEMGTITAFVAFGLILPVWVLGKELIQLWIGASGNSWLTVACLASGVAIAQVQNSNYFIALGGGSILPVVKSQVVTSIIVLLATFLGSTRLGWGPLEISVMIAILMFIRSVIYLGYTFSKQFRYDYIEYMLKVYLIPASITIIVGFVGYISNSIIQVEGLLPLVLKTIVLIVAYVSLGAWFCLPKSVLRWIIATVCRS